MSYYAYILKNYDNEIIGVFDDEDEARKACDLYNVSFDSDIEEYELNEYPRMNREGTLPFYMEVDFDSKRFHAERMSISDFEDESITIAYNGEMIYMNFPAENEYEANRTVEEIYLSLVKDGIDKLLVGYDGTQDNVRKKAENNILDTVNKFLYGES